MVARLRSPNRNTENGKQGTKLSPIPFQPEEEDEAPTKVSRGREFLNIEQSKTKLSKRITKPAEKLNLHNEEKCVAQSTAEAELYAVNTSKELISIIETCKEINIKLKPPSPIYVDNQAVLHIMKSDKLTRNIKHVGIRKHFLQEEIEHKRIRLEAIPSEDNLADIFTKPLPKDHFTTLRSSITSCRFRRGNKVHREQHRKSQHLQCTTGQSHPCNRYLTLPLINYLH